jgi:hypothetical protein
MNMPQNYMRQRQGRDFSLINYLRTAEMNEEGNYNNIDGIIGNSAPKDDVEKRKTLHERLEQYKAEAERNAAPVDGRDPSPERGI